MNGERKVLRRLDLCERFLYLYNQRAHKQFCLAVEINGRMERTAMEAAFVQVLHRHPLLSTRVGEEAGFLVFVAADLAMALRFETEEDWLRLAESEITTPMGGRDLPPFRIVASVHEQRATLVFTFDHSVADALAGMTVVEDFLWALAGRQLSSTGVPPSLQDCAARTDKSDPAAAAVPNAATLSNFSSATTKVTPRISAAKLDRATTEDLVSVCHRHDATLHGAFVAAAARTLARQGQAAATIFNAVNLRKAIGASDGICGCYVLFAKTEIVTDETFWTTARRVSRTAAGIRSPEVINGILNRMSDALPGDASPDVAVRLMRDILADLSITNMGALEIPHRIGDLEVASVRGPIVWNSDPGKASVGVAGFRGEIQFVETSHPHSRSMLGELLDEIRGQVPQLVHESRA